MNDPKTSFSVGELARMAGVSVRTLHHYDAIGLLSPEQRSGSGYRLYGPEAVGRLREILTYRELGFALEEIAELLDGSSHGLVERLAEQRQLIGRQAKRLAGIANAIDKEMEAQKMGTTLTAAERLEVFGEFDPADHEAEARERWGKSDAYATSARRTASYSKAQWQQIRAESDQLGAGFAAAMAEGEAPDSERAMDLAEAHRAHISQWFYECSAEMHVELTRLYVDDPRFARHYERRAKGLGGYIQAAARANLQR